MFHFNRGIRVTVPGWLLININDQERTSNDEYVPRSRLMHLDVQISISEIVYNETFVIIKIRTPRLKPLASAFQNNQIAKWLMIPID